MDTPMPPEEVARVLQGMSFFQKRALKKAGFKQDGLVRLAGTEYGAGLAEAVLACHTDLLGREPRADEPEKAKAAQRHPGVRAATSSRDLGGRLGQRPGPAEHRSGAAGDDGSAEEGKEGKEASRKEQRDRPAGERKLP